MAFLTCDIPASFLDELTRRAGTGGSVSSLVSEALAGYLDEPRHTLFQVSTSGSLVEGVYAQAVTCAKLLEHGDFGLGTFTGVDGCLNPRVSSGGTKIGAKIGGADMVPL